MEFWIEKCAMLTMKKEKREATELNCSIGKVLENSGKKKTTDTWEYLNEHH